MDDALLTGGVYSGTLLAFAASLLSLPSGSPSGCRAGASPRDFLACPSDVPGAAATTGIPFASAGACSVPAGFAGPSACPDGVPSKFGGGGGRLAGTFTGAGAANRGGGGGIAIFWC